MARIGNPPIYPRGAAAGLLDRLPGRTLEGGGAGGVAVVAQGPAAGPLPDRPGLVRAHRAHEAGQVVRPPDQEHLLPGGEEAVDPLPGVADQAGPARRRLEDAGGGREAGGGHRLAVEVQHQAGAAVERRVQGGGAVADGAYVGRQREPLPARAAEDEAGLRDALGGPQEVVPEAGLPVREAVAQEEDVAGQGCVRGHRVVVRRVDGVVHRDDPAGPQVAVGRHDRVAPAVGEDAGEAGDQGTQVRVRGGALGQGGGGVHVPEGHRHGGGVVGQPGLHLAVEGPAVVALDDQVGLRPGGAQLPLQRFPAGDDAHLAVGRVLGQIAVVLTVVDVLLHEADAVPPGAEGPAHPAVVGRCPVPVGRDDAGAEDDQLQAQARRGRTGARRRRLRVTPAMAVTNVD